MPVHPEMIRNKKNTYFIKLFLFNNLYFFTKEIMHGLVISS